MTIQSCTVKQLYGRNVGRIVIDCLVEYRLVLLGLGRPCFLQDIFVQTKDAECSWVLDHYQ